MNKTKRTCIITFLLLFPLSVEAQNVPAYAIDRVTIHHSDGTVVESGTLVWRVGVIEALGSSVTIPFDAFVIDGGDSLHVYPGFIDGLGYWGAPDLPRLHESVPDPGNPGYERAGIQPQRSARDYFDASSSDISEIMKAGVTTAALGLQGYMLPGQPDLFFLNGEQTGDHLVRSGTGFQFAFEGAPGGFSNRAYPNTTMGVMARFRQLLYDAEALRDHITLFASSDEAMAAPGRDRVLESLIPVLNHEAALYAVIDDPEDIERLLVLQDEFGFDVVIVSGKNAAYSAHLLRERAIPVLASIDLPEKPEWMDDEDAPAPASEEEEHYRMRQGQAWEDAARNIRKLLDEGVAVGFASAGLSAKDFHKKILALIENGGLSEQEILEILTVNTADILNIGSRTGELKTGNFANFSVFSSPWFEEDTETKMIISNGVIHEF